MIAHPPAVSAVVVRAMTVAVRAYDRFRAYSGTLHCCCNPFSATGVVNRMDAVQVVVGSERAFCTCEALNR